MGLKSPYRTTVSFPLEIPKLEEVDETSDRKGMTRSAYIRLAIENQLKRDNQQGEY